MVQLTGETMSVSEETAVAVALTRMDSKLELIQQALAHQTELMGRNRDDASRDIQGCKEDILELEARCDTLEAAETGRKAQARMLTVIVGITGTLLGLAISLITKLI